MMNRFDKMELIRDKVYVAISEELGESDGIAEVISNELFEQLLSLDKDED